MTPSLFLSELFNLPISHTVGQEGSSASAQTLSDKGHPHIFKYFLCYKYAIPLLISHFLVHGALLGGVSKNTQSILDVSSPGNGLSSVTLSILLLIYIVYILYSVLNKRRKSGKLFILRELIILLQL